MMVWIAATSSLLAIVPVVLFMRNLSLYAPLPRNDGQNRAKCSVLIPARNEADNIALALRSVLQSDDLDLEVIVLDDESNDRTADIVREIASKDSRVRIETTGFLPAGWCGKNFACYQMAQLA
ncbi:MAG TPA: glycosyltransferase family 2 protein, partial [Chthoniobacterales bacterium]|nr:glycosyltransferase family 2 protein [Chthoniobacterales bacterium]